MGTHTGRLLTKALYPAGVQEPRNLMTNKQLKDLQDAADRDNLLLPTGFNQPFERKIADDTDDINENFTLKLDIVMIYRKNIEISKNPTYLDEYRRQKANSPNTQY